MPGRKKKNPGHGTAAGRAGIFCRRKGCSIATADAPFVPFLAAGVGTAYSLRGHRDAMSSATVARAAAAALLPLVVARTAATADAACANVVYCLAGTAYLDAAYTSPMGVTCAVACDGHCCTGTQACDNGRFAVCADAGDGSCDGKEGARLVAAEGGRACSLRPHVPPRSAPPFLPSQRAISWVVNKVSSGSSPVAAVLDTRVCLSWWTWRCLCPSGASSTFSCSRSCYLSVLRCWLH